MCKTGAKCMNERPDPKALGFAPDDQRDTPLVLSLSEGLGLITCGSYQHLEV